MLLKETLPQPSVRGSVFALSTGIMKYSGGNTPGVGRGVDCRLAGAEVHGVEILLTDVTDVELVLGVGLVAGGLPRFDVGSASATLFRGLLGVHCTLRPACSLNPQGTLFRECFSRSCYLLPPPPVLPAGPTEAGWKSHPPKNPLFTAYAKELNRRTSVLTLRAFSLSCVQPVRSGVAIGVGLEGGRRDRLAAERQVGRVGVAAVVQFVFPKQVVVVEEGVDGGLSGCFLPGPFFQPAVATFEDQPAHDPDGDAASGGSQLRRRYWRQRRRG